MRWDRLTFMALGGIAVFMMGIALLLEEERPLFVRVFAMVGGIAALAMANHERLSCAWTLWKSVWRSANGGSRRKRSGTDETTADRI
jgi:uncharacterized membrane protein YfcA